MARSSMNDGNARCAGLLVGVAVLFGACSARYPGLVGTNDDDINTYPSNYKSDILAAMHSYLNDPTGIRDAGISQPAQKLVGTTTRYVACVQFNAKKNAAEYAGAKEVAAVFLSGRFDRFIETPREQCAGVTYAAFPELQKLPP